MKDEIEKYFDRLWPINRSLTGNGNRKTLEILSELVDFNILEIPSGKQCFDWAVPPEWNVKEAWIKDSSGNVIIDFKNNNLHLVSYSEKIFQKLNLNELKKHLHYSAEQPEVIPYLTTYYKQDWGFCLNFNQFQNLKDDVYEICIDSEFNPHGSMTIGEAVLRGSSSEEILLSTYICHPSMANNELSGPLVTSFIYKKLKEKQNNRYTYRFLFMPETIGSICYLSMKGNELKKELKAGYVVTCVGDNGNFTYKRSRQGDSLADRAAEQVLNQHNYEYSTENFFPTGSDERQYCSPGFDLPVGSIMRTRYGTYKEYHTSADNKDFISFDAMEKSIELYLEILDVLDNNYFYLSKSPYCEPQLGKRGLYPTLGAQKNTTDYINALMWILNLSDGHNDIIEISKRSSISLKTLIQAAERLKANDLIKVKL